MPMAKSRAKFAQGQQSLRGLNKVTGNNMILKEGIAKQGLLKRNKQGRPEKEGDRIKCKGRGMKALRKYAIG